MGIGAVPKPRVSAGALTLLPPRSPLSPRPLPSPLQVAGVLYKALMDRELSVLLAAEASAPSTSQLAAIRELVEAQVCVFRGGKGV